MTTTSRTTDLLDRLASSFVAQDPTNVKLDALENGIEDTAASLRSIASEQGGHWTLLDSDDGEQALIDAISSLRW